MSSDDEAEKAAADSGRKLCGTMWRGASALAVQLLHEAPPDVLLAFGKERDAGRLHTQIVVDIEASEIVLQVTHPKWPAPRVLTRVPVRAQDLQR